MPDANASCNTPLAQHAWCAFQASSLPPSLQAHNALCFAAFAGSHGRDTEALAVAIEERGGRQYVDAVSTGALGYHLS